MAKKQKSNTTASTRRSKVQKASRNFYDPMQSASDLDSIQYTDVTAAPSVAGSKSSMPMMGGGKAQGGGKVSYASGSQDRSSVKNTGNCRTLPNGQRVCGVGSSRTVSSSPAATVSSPPKQRKTVAPILATDTPQQVQEKLAAQNEVVGSLRSDSINAAEQGNYITANTLGPREASEQIRLDEMAMAQKENIILGAALENAAAETYKTIQEGDEAKASAALFREGTGEGTADGIAALNRKLISLSDPEGTTLVGYIEGRQKIASNTNAQPNVSQGPNGEIIRMQTENSARTETVGQEQTANFRRQGIALMQNTVILSGLNAYNFAAPEESMTAPDEADVQLARDFSVNAATQIANSFAASGQLASNPEEIKTLIETEVYDPMLRQSTKMVYELNAKKLAELQQFDVANGTNYAEIEQRNLNEKAMEFSRNWSDVVTETINEKAVELGQTRVIPSDTADQGFLSNIYNFFGGGDDSQAATAPDDGSMTLSPDQQQQLMQVYEKQMSQQEPNVMLAPDLRSMRRTL